MLTNMEKNLESKLIQPGAALRLAFFSTLLLAASCSGLKLDKDTNCLNEKSGCFKADKTAPKVIDYVSEPPPDSNGKISSLAYVDVTFSEEPKGADIATNYAFENNTQGGDLIVTSVQKLSDYKYRIFAAGNVGDGAFTLNYSKLIDYAGNHIDTLAKPVVMNGSSKFIISANIDHLGVSSGGGYANITLSFSHNYSADQTNNNSYEVRITSGAAQCVNTDPTPSVGVPIGSSLAAGSTITLTNIPSGNFAIGQNRIVVCVKNQVNPSAVATWSSSVYRFDNSPAITTGFSPVADAYQASSPLTITCTGFNSKIVYTSEWLQSGAPANPATPTFDGSGNPGTGNLYTNPIPISNNGNPTNWKFSWRCIDIAGNQSSLTSNVAYTIDSTLPGVMVNLDSSYRAFVSTIGGYSSTTLNFTSDQANHQYNIASGTTLCSPGGGGTSLIGSGPFYTNASANGANPPQVIPAGSFTSVSPAVNHVRICVQGTVSTVWGTAYLQIIRDDTAPSVAANTPTGSYGALQDVTFTCNDPDFHGDKVAYTIATQTGSIAPAIPPLDPTFNATTGDITNGFEQTGPYSPPDQSTTIVKFKCIDKAGNQSSVQTTQYTIDATLPAVNFVSQNHAGISSTAGAFASADVVWNANRAGLQYRVRRVANCNHAGDPGNTILSGTTPTVGTNITSNLTTAMLPTNNNQYPIRLCVFNYANQSTYQSTNVTVTRDDTPPTILAANLTPTITAAGGTNYTISWNAADDTAGSGVAFYRIFRDGAMTPTFPGYPNTPDYIAVATAGTNSATIAMPDASKYYLRIVPVDAAGNVMALAASYNVIATRLNLIVSVTGYTTGAGDFRVQQGGDTLAFNTTPGGTQTFATGFTPGSSYSVSITAQPTNQICSFVPKQFGTITSDLTLQVQCLQGQWVGGNYRATPPVPLNYLLYRGKVTTLAGNGVAGFVDNGTGTSAQFQNPEFLVYLNNALYVADSNNRRVRRVDLTGSYAVTTTAGSATAAAGDTTDDGACTTAKFGVMTAIATDGVNLYTGEYSPARRIRKISDFAGTCTVSTFAGAGPYGYTDGPAATAQFSDIYSLVSDGTSLFVSENGNNRIRKIDLATGTVSTIAGNGAAASVDSGIGTSASFNSPTGMTVIGTDLYLGDVCWTCSGNNGNTIRKISLIAPYPVTTVAGVGGTAALADGPGSTAKFNTPIALTTDGTSIFVADLNNSVIRRIDPKNGYRVSTLAGSTAWGHADGTGPAAVINRSHGIATDGRRLYFGEWGGHRIKKLEDAGLVGYWAINPGVNPNDYSSDNTASLHGSVLGGPLSTLADRFGNANKASLFNGTSQSISASATGLPTGNAPRTMCAWVKPTAAPTAGHLIATYGNPSVNQSFGLYQSYVSGVENVGLTGYAQDVVVPYILSTTKWTHLCAWANGTTGKLFLNGKVIGSYANTFATGSTGLRIGAQQGNTQYFGGGIADVRIYNRALSEGEINELAQDAASAQVGQTFSTGGTGLLAHYTLANSTAPQGPVGSSLSAAGSGGSLITGKDGAPNGAFYYDGGGYHFTNAYAGLPVGNAPRTHCGWVRPANKIATGQYFTLLQYGLNGTNQKSGLWLRDNAGVKKLVNGGGGNDHEATFNFPINTWIHVCNTYDGTNSSLYANGQLLDTASYPAWNTQAGALGLGRDLPTAGFLTGGLADIRIYDNALTANQIRQLATQVPAGLVLRIDTNGDFNDVSGFGNSLVSNPGTLVAGRRGIASTAYRFVAPQQAQIAHAAEIMQQTDITWSFWMKSPDMSSVVGQILGKYVVTPNSGWVIKYDQVNYAHGWTVGTAGNGAFSNSHPVPSNNVWNHYAYVRSGAGLTIYINGVSYSNITAGNGTAIIPNTVDLNIGLNAGSGDVSLQDVRIYNRALSTSEVQALTGYHAVQSASGLSLHVQADTFSNLSDGNAITTNWRNSVIQTPASGSGTVAGNPRYVSGTSSLLGGMPAVEFDGTAGKYFDFGFPTYTYSGVTVCTAATRKGNSYRGLVEKRGATATTNSWGMLTDLPTSALKFEMDSTASAEVVTAIADDTPAIYCVVSGAGNLLSSYLNGQASSSVSKTIMSGSNADRLVVGSRFDLASSYYGQIGEVFVMTKDASAAERRIAECYLSAKYSIPMTGGAVCP